MLFSKLAHLFVPHPDNNHQAKLRQNKGLLLLIGLILFSRFSFQLMERTKPDVLGYSSSITAEEILRLTNEKRVEQGLSPLRLDDQLADAARRKASDMFAQGYWAHVTPTGVQPWSFITATGYTYLYAGENLARDFSNAQTVVDAWMASPLHRENLLNVNYNDIGIAVSDGDLNGVQTILVVQMFGTRRIPNGISQTTSSSVVKKDEARVLPTSTPVLIDVPVSSGTAVVVSMVDNKEEDVVNDVAIAKTDLNLTLGDMGAPFISPFDVSKAVGLAVVILLVLVLIIDEVVMGRKHLGRIAGRSWAHFAFLITTLGILLLSQQGIIL